MKRVAALSGGEKSRLKLCLMMQNSVNFLLLDEPTNHLDIASREWIENVLTDFEGTMLFVSHDRYFLNKFADKIWSMDNGMITEYDCGFDEYLELTRPAAIQSKKTAAKVLAAKGKIPTQKPISTETMIDDVEAELNKINMAIDSELLKSDFSKINELYEEKNRLEKKIEFLYSEWLKNS